MSAGYAGYAICICAVFGAATSASAAGGVEVERRRGVPVLTIDGEPAPPLIFFHNTDVRGEGSERYLRRQVALARDAGVHLYSLPLRCPRKPDGVTPNYEYSDGLLDRFIQVDPEARFLLRVYPGPNWSWKQVREETIPEGEFVRFADGSSPGLSIASDSFRRGANEELRQLVSRYEGSEYAGRILGWQPGGPYHEMFLSDYRQKGPDYSRANERGFRNWLREKYGTDAALRDAWDDGEVSLDSAEIPAFRAGRFPMRQGAGGSLTGIFYDLPSERNWVDFSAYMSDITAERIIEWARIVKEHSGGRRLAGFFYGYTFDLPGSIAGHYRLGRVLDCPDVDFVASPYSYAGRSSGEPGGFMSPVDSVPLHGKLWFNEDDTRTSVLDLEGVPEHFALFDEKCADLEETLGVLERNFGNILMHRAGTWWMDLVSRGAFNEPRLWDMLQERKGLYAELYEEPYPYRPDVAVIVDEESKLYVKDDWDANWWLLYRLRDNCARTGASVGYYLLDDFVGGLVPECRVYVFANAFQLTDEEIGAMRGRLDEEEATAMWIYAAGCIGPAGVDPGRMTKVTGMEVAFDKGKLGTEGRGLLEGERWGARLSVSPRVIITDDEARPLGRYASGGGVSAAESRTGNHRSVVLGDMGPSPKVLRKLFESAGCHIWTDGGEIVQTDGRFLMIHSGSGGSTVVNVPAGVTLEPIGGAIGQRDGQGTTVDFEAGETRWFRLDPPLVH